MKRTWRLGVLAILAAAALLAVVACTKKEAATAPNIDIGAADFSFTLPASVAGGLTRMTLTNNGKDPHHGQLLKLNDGVTQQQFDAKLQKALTDAQTQGEAAFFQIFEVATLAGGPSTADPGKKAVAIQNMAAGQYMMVCFASGADHVPHIAKGMMKAFAVTAAPAAQPAPPKADATVDAVDFAFNGAPAQVKPGKVTWSFADKGKEPHEMAVLRLKGVTFDQFKQAQLGPPGQRPAGPPPFEFAGGAQAIMPGASGWTELDLTAGEYALLCFIPSPAQQGKPHFALGMLKGLTVK